MGRRILMNAMLTMVAACAQTEPVENVVVWIYNYAGVEPEYLAKAEEAASRILATARVRMEWVDCPVVAADRDLFPACRVERAPVRLVLRIQAGYPRRDFRLPPAVFGLSYLDEKGKGAYADVYAPGAELLARPHPELRSVMLGHLMAHELGHLLLASPAHAGTGIMQSPWKGHTVQLARQGGLTFIDVQADRIAANLRRRRESLPAPGLAGGGSN